MTRLVLLIAMMSGLALAFVTHSPGLLGLGLLLAIVGLFGFIFSLAAARVSANARPDTSMASVEDLIALRARPARGSAAPATEPTGAPEHPR